MGRCLYFLPVRGHLGDAELTAAFVASQSAGETRYEVKAAKTAADTEGQNAADAAVAVILTYADFDITAARKLLDALPACGGGVFCLITNVPEGAPFLPKLRERADTLRGGKNTVAIMEITATAGQQQFDNAAAKLRTMVFAENDGGHYGADGGIIGDNTMMDESATRMQTPADAVRSAHLAVRDVL